MLPRYQLEISIVLAVSALGSSAALLWSNFTENKKGKIQLPLHDDGNALLDGQGHDSFDVTTSEDTLDGYPVDEAELFWNRMRWKKVWLSLVLAITLALNGSSLGYAIVEGNEETLIVDLLHLVFSVYLVVLSTLSVFKSNVDAHTKYVIHITSLTALAALILASASILPSTPPPASKPSIVSLANGIEGIWYLLVGLYTIACVTAFTTPLGPSLYFPPEDIYSEKTVKSITNPDKENVAGIVGASPWDILMFSYTTKVVMLGNVASSLEIGDLPILPVDMRSTFNYSEMKKALRTIKPRLFNQTPQPGSGWSLVYRLFRVNWVALVAEFMLAAITAILFYAPAIFLRRLIEYLEVDPGRDDRRWGWVYVVGLFGSNVIGFLIAGQVWSVATTSIQVRMKIQLNSILFAKTLVRKNIASSSGSTSTKDDDKPAESATKSEDEDEFSSKAQVMTLMTTDVDRVSEFAWHFFTLVDAPIEIAIGTWLLYNLLGVSCFFGLAVICLLILVNSKAGSLFVGVQENLMKSRDKRVALMNEILGAIRMFKFMAWERNFEEKVMDIRRKELKFQKLHYTIETLWSTVWHGTSIAVTLISFWHYAIVRGKPLTPSIAFTSIIVFNEMESALNGLPETFINMLQSFVSLRRIEKYLISAEVKPVPPLAEQSKNIAFHSCTVTWPQDRGLSSNGSSLNPSVASTPRQNFSLIDLNLNFPSGELSLICGKLGSGKTLLLMALLGEADVLSGQVLCPRSPLDAMAQYSKQEVKPEEWTVDGMCAYVPQAAWLRNASIKENILFNMPYNEERYQKTLKVCELISDLDILEDGDDSEIGEHGINLSGGQKARISLARAVYSRASTLFLDDVLSAVDAHTAHHLYNECLKGDMMKGRTVILVSHHVQLCAPGASYIVALDNGRVIFEGDNAAFDKSGIITTLGQVNQSDDKQNEEEKKQLIEAEEKVLASGEIHSESSSAISPSSTAAPKEKKPARKLVEDETRAVGRVKMDVWRTYFAACGGYRFWALCSFSFIFASVVPVAENWWLKTWAEATDTDKTPGYYITIYAAISAVRLISLPICWLVLYAGTIHASTVLYKRLLEAILFTDVRFHDTVSRGRLLNRFGKDFEGIDSNLPDNFAFTVIQFLSALTTIITVSTIGGVPFIIAIMGLGVLYYNAAKVYGQTSRDMRRLDSVSRSPLYSIYGETIAGVPVLRAFGASSKLLRDMLRCVDTNSNPYYWMWGVNRWLSIRFNLLSAGFVGVAGVACLLSPSINASLAGFALAFASTITNDLLFMVRRFVALEQSMVALERVFEYSALKQEPPEFVEPRPPASWPSSGNIQVEDLVIRYAPDLPDVLHHLNFEIHPGEKVGILGRTGSGKSTLALSFFRFVEPVGGRIVIDGLDISSLGLTDLRSRLTIIPQDPTILSGTLRSTLDVFDEYEDLEIYEALRRVHLIPSDDLPAIAETENVNVFGDLDSVVSEGGENFSTGEKQLLCMARAILKRSKVLIMDEATASVDYATDELIGKTIRQEFTNSSILTIAHRLRTVIDYDRIMLLDQGRIVEFDKPATLLSDPESKFYALCKATGKTEFATLRKMAGLD